MRRYLFDRAWQSLVTLLLATLVVFLGIRALPGDPALALAGEDRTPEALRAIRQEYGLDQSLPVQFWSFVRQLVHGQLGTSIRTGVPVSSMMRTALPVTLELSLIAIVIAIIVGVGAGVVAAAQRGRPAEWLANGVALIGLSIPHFWLGLIAILYLSVATGLFPASGFVPLLEDPIGNLHHLVLPAVILGTGLAAVIMRQTRSSMLDSLATDYVRTARAKGVSERRILVRHALRCSLIPIVSLFGLDFGALVGGSALLTEVVFDLPGLGRLTFSALQSTDLPVIISAVVYAAFFVVVANAAVDLLYARLDPRVRHA